jgi:hypothetical protein
MFSLYQEQTSTCQKDNPAAIGAFSGTGGDTAVALLLHSDRLWNQSGDTMVGRHCDFTLDTQWSKQMEDLYLQ